MNNDSQRPLKFVRLNLTGEIVEVVNQSPVDVTINYQGERMTLYHQEVSPLTPEEEAAHIRSKKP